MTGQDKIKHGYRVSIRQIADVAGSYLVSYVPRRLQQGRENGEAAQEISATIEAVTEVEGDEVIVHWKLLPSDPQVPTEEFQADVQARVRLLHDWLCRLSSLITSVELWMKSLDWSTRRIEKSMEDTQIGKYKAPVLIMQEGTQRVQLEPIGRNPPGTEGVVDLYLMPAYDDIASLYYYDGRWNLHYIVPGTVGAPNTRQAPPQPLCKETLQAVLAEMSQPAA